MFALHAARERMRRQLAERGWDAIREPLLDAARLHDSLLAFERADRGEHESAALVDSYLRAPDE